MTAIGNPFSFEGPIGRRPFILVALALFLIQQAVHHLLVGEYLFSPTAFANPWFNPLHGWWKALFLNQPSLDGVAIGLPVALILLAEWALAAIAYRRARTTGESGGLAALAVVPFVQIAVCAWLAFRPADSDQPDDATLRRRERWHAALVGVLAGSAIAVVMAIVFTVVLEEYGVGLFVGVPLFIGFVAAYAANRRGDIGLGSTVRVSWAALALGSLALAGFALEGLVCLLIALPLGAVIAAIGAGLGRAWVVRRGYRQSTFLSVSFLPLLLAVEVMAPPSGTFESVESIDIAATPAQVWESVVHMGPIPDRPSAPFGWGLAYPERGTIHGEGVGAVRKGVFSTGVAYERVTRWEPGQKLEFVVLSDPPSMRELSPFATVHAPHAQGYFRTRDARFTITKLGHGRSRLTLATRHDLDIGPTLYWQQFAQWAVHANKRRVLGHFRNQAERAARTG